MKSNSNNTKLGPIGVFDSGYGGLTILKKFKEHLPQYDFIYLGDNARAPYGTRSFEIVYEFTLQAVKKLFKLGCSLVILACNTASAKALRSIQVNDLPKIDPSKRVLGVIRPTAEYIGNVTSNNHVGILATPGTIKSQSYNLEVKKLHPEINLSGEACPMWVPLVEYNEFHTEGADYFVRQHVENLFFKDRNIDTVILGCTHYPLLIPKIKQFLPDNVKLIAQGELVAESLKDYLKRHPEMDERCSKNGNITFYTTECIHKFSESALTFLEEEIDVNSISIEEE